MSKKILSLANHLIKHRENTSTSARNDCASLLLLFSPPQPENHMCLLHLENIPSGGVFPLSPPAAISLLWVCVFNFYFLLSLRGRAGKMFLSQTKEEIAALLDGKQQDKSKSEAQLQVGDVWGCGVAASEDSRAPFVFFTGPTWRLLCG